MKYCDNFISNIAMSRLLKAYLSVLNRHPLKTQALTAGTLMGSGDVISQFAIERKSAKDYSFKRTGRFLVFGTFLLGPALRYWYIFLDRVVTRPAPIGVVQKIFLDQSVFAPSFLIVFLSTNTYWTTRSIESTVDKLKKDYFSILINGYKLWIPAQSITFYLIPPQHRILFVSTVALFWNTYLAYRSTH